MLSVYLKVLSLMFCIIIINLLVLSFRAYVETLAETGFWESRLFVYLSASEFKLSLKFFSSIYFFLLNFYSS